MARPVVRRLHVLLGVLLALVGLTLWDFVEAFRPHDKTVLGRLSGTADADNAHTVFRAEGWWPASTRSHIDGLYGAPDATYEQWRCGRGRVGVWYDNKNQVVCAGVWEDDQRWDTWLMRLLGIPPGG